MASNTKGKDELRDTDKPGDGSSKTTEPASPPLQDSEDDKTSIPTGVSQKDGSDSGGASSGSTLSSLGHSVTGLMSETVHGLDPRELLSSSRSSSLSTHSSLYADGSDPNPVSLEFVDTKSATEQATVKQTSGAGPPRRKNEKKGDEKTGEKRGKKTVLASISDDEASSSVAKHDPTEKPLPDAPAKDKLDDKAEKRGCIGCISVRVSMIPASTDISSLCTQHRPYLEGKKEDCFLLNAKCPTKFTYRFPPDFIEELLASTGGSFGNLKRVDNITVMSVLSVVLRAAHQQMAASKSKTAHEAEAKSDTKTAQETPITLKDLHAQIASMPSADLSALLATIAVKDLLVMAILLMLLPVAFELGRRTAAT